MPVVKQTMKLPNGELLELYYVGRLARALGRTPETIRKWEIAGVIPDPCFRDKLSNRLYSQEQIDTIVKCAEESCIKQGKRLSDTPFSRHCTKELKVLKDKYSSQVKKV